MIDSIDKQILLEISDDLNLSKDLFGEISSKVGISKDELLKRLQNMQEQGILKRIAPIIKHYNTEYIINAMVVWIIEEYTKQQVESLIKNYEHISHVYERKSGEDWPYNFYTMIHGQSTEEIVKIVGYLSKDLGSDTYKILYTKRQWKKTSPDMNYYLSME